jgi:hypothetical protein
MPVERKSTPIHETYEMNAPQVLPDEYLEEELSISSNDLDIPAFLRRGRRIAVKTMG